MPYPVLHFVYGKSATITIQVKNLRAKTDVRVEHEQPNLVHWSKATNIQRDLSTGIMSFDATPTNVAAGLIEKLEEKADQDFQSHGISPDKSSKLGKELVEEFLKIVKLTGGGDGYITITTSNGGVDDPNPAEYYSTYS